MLVCCLEHEFHDSYFSEGLKHVKTTNQINYIPLLYQKWLLGRCGFEGWSGQRGSSGEVPLLLDVRHLHAWLEARTSKGMDFRLTGHWIPKTETLLLVDVVYNICIIYIYILIPESSKPHKPTAWRIRGVEVTGLGSYHTQNHYGALYLYTTKHCFASIPFHRIALHSPCIALPSIALHYIPFHCFTFHFITLQCICRKICYDILCINYTYVYK